VLEQAGHNDLDAAPGYLAGLQRFLAE
jgi:hypothetical protein